MRFLRRNSRRTSKKVSITLLFLLVTMMGVGYAYINSTLKIEGTTIITKNNWNVHFGNIDTVNGTLNDNESINISQDKTTITFNINLETIEDSYEIDVDIVNDGGIDAMLNSISLTGLSDIQKEYLEFYATYNNGDNLTINDLLPAGEFDVISVFIKYKEGLTLNDLSNTTEYLSLNLTLGYGQAKKEIYASRGTNLVKKISETAVSDSFINYLELSSDTNGKGIYVMKDTINDVNPIYFYRGSIDNNYVVFGNYCWQIVRTTNTGGTKLIYSGVPISSKCTATGTDKTIGLSPYNLSGSDNTFVGYMYSNKKSSTLEETQSNLYESTLKQYIDKWYENNMISYTNKLEDTVWCNNRSTIKNGTGLQLDKTDYKELGSIPNKDVINCPAKNDSFTVSEKNGNGMLKYPVATITAMELSLAGYHSGHWGTDPESYLGIDNYWWTMTPSTLKVDVNDNRYACIVSLHSNNSVSEWGVWANHHYVRPMIFLKRGTRFISGDGTQNNPYIVN